MSRSDSVSYLAYAKLSSTFGDPRNPGLDALDQCTSLLLTAFGPRIVFLTQRQGFSEFPPT